MEQRERIVHMIYEAVDQVNDDLPARNRLEKSLDTVLLGPSSRLDSIGLVNLIVATEGKVADQFGVVVTLADERAMSQSNSPFRTIGRLADYVDLVLRENGCNG
jgi:hypothetical protein